MLLMRQVAGRAKRCLQSHTSTDPGTSFASRRGRLRDRQFLRGEFQPAPLRRAPQQEHLFAGLLVHAIAGSVYARTPQGLLKAWWSPASSAELPTRGVLIFTVANIHINNECAKPQPSMPSLVNESGLQSRQLPVADKRRVAFVRPQCRASRTQVS